MLTGYNHNVRYRDRIFHVQTEEGGEQHPTVTTHLFVGGGILASRRTDYRELLAIPGWEDRLRTLMQEQHKAMVRSLLSGEYDALIDRERGP